MLSHRPECGRREASAPLETPTNGLIRQEDIAAGQWRASPERGEEIKVPEPVVRDLKSLGHGA